MAERSFSEPVSAAKVVDDFDNIPMKPKRSLNEDYLALIAVGLAGFATALAIMATIVTFTR